MPSETFEINAGVGQGDSISANYTYVPFCVDFKFIIALNKAVKDIDQRGTIFIQSTHICAYVDDIAFIARSKQRIIKQRIGRKRKRTRINFE